MIPVFLTSFHKTVRTNWYALNWTNGCFVKPTLYCKTFQRSEIKRLISISNVGTFKLEDECFFTRFTSLKFWLLIVYQNKFKTNQKWTMYTNLVISFDPRKVFIVFIQCQVSLVTVLIQSEYQGLCGGRFFAGG